MCVFHYPYWLNRCDRNTYLQTQSKVINKGQQRRVSNSGFRHEPVKSSSLHQHTQPKLNSRLETTPEIASHNVNDSTEKEAGDLGKECEEEEGDERKESENEEKKRKEMKRMKIIKWNHMSNILPQILSKVLDVNVSGNIRSLGGRIFYGRYR